MKYILSICIVLIAWLFILNSCQPGKQSEEQKNNTAEISEAPGTGEIDSGDEVVETKTIKEKTTVNIDTLIGRWLRPDGNYILQIDAFKEDRKIEAQYFNPRPIHIERAELIPDENLRVFIEFNDRGYEGSSYDLIYNLANDALVGKYFQATYGQTYQIAFIRLQE